MIGKLVSSVDHAVYVTYDGKYISIPPRGTIKRVDSDLVGTIPEGIYLIAEGMPSGIWFLNDVSDVDAESPTIGHVLSWTGLKWEPAVPGSLTLALDDLSDCVAPAPTVQGKLLFWNNTTHKWVVGEHSDIADSGTNTHIQIDNHIANSAIHTAVDLALNDITDVVAGSPVDGYVLTFTSGTSKWVPAAPVSGLQDDQAATITGLWDFDVHPTGLIHGNLANSGTNSHTDIDNHIANNAIHFAKNTITLNDLSGVNVPTPGSDQVLTFSGSQWIAQTFTHVTAHNELLGIGFYTHPQLDSHVNLSGIHFAMGSIDHTAIQNKGTNTHAQIDGHIADLSTHFVKSSILINDLSNVNVSGAVPNEVLTLIGSDWVPRPVSVSPSSVPACYDRIAFQAAAGGSVGGSTVQASYAPVVPNEGDKVTFVAGKAIGITGYELGYQADQIKFEWLVNESGLGIYKTMKLVEDGGSVVNDNTMDAHDTDVTLTFAAGNGIELFGTSTGSAEGDIIKISGSFVSHNLSAHSDVAGTSPNSGDVLIWNGSDEYEPGPMFVNAAGNDGELQFNTSDTLNSSAQLIWNNSTNQLGVGAVSPSSTLHVYDGTEARASFESTGDSNFNIGVATSSIRIGWETNDVQLGTCTTPSLDGFAEKFRLTTTGRLGVGVINPGESIETSGAIRIGSEIGSSAGTIRYSGDVFSARTTTGWEQFAPVPAISINALTDVNVTPSVDQIIRWAGSSWTNQDWPNVSDCPDVDYSSTEQGHVLQWVTDKWENDYVDRAVLTNHSIEIAGSIRWNGTNFQGYDGSSWVNLDYNP